MRPGGWRGPHRSLSFVPAVRGPRPGCQIQVCPLPSSPPYLVSLGDEGLFVTADKAAFLTLFLSPSGQLVASHHLLPGSGLLPPTQQSCLAASVGNVTASSVKQALRPKAEPRPRWGPRVL